MTDSLRSSLLTNRNAPFQKLYEQCLVKIQRIKQKNDFMQKQIGEDIEDQIGEQVRKQKKFLEKEIEEIKEIMDEIQIRFKDPQSKNKLKFVKSEAQKQIQRNKVIMKDFVNKSFMRSFGNKSNENQDEYMEEGYVNYRRLAAEEEEKKHSILTDEPVIEKQLNIDFELERKMMGEKKQLMRQVEETTLRVNAILTDMGGMVEEQGEGLDIISDQMMKAHKNVAATNEQLDEAAKQQKKSKKKYIILSILIIIIVAGVVGVVFIMKK